MKKHTLIETIHDTANHIYLVTIGTDMGQFTGSTVCQEEDFDTESEYFGFELAEIKAEIAYARAKRNYWNARWEALAEFWRGMSDTRTYDVDSFWVKKMRVAVQDADCKRAFWKDRIMALKEVYHNKIVLRDESNKRLKAKGLRQ